MKAQALTTFALLGLALGKPHAQIVQRACSANAPSASSVSSTTTNPSTSGNITTSPQTGTGCGSALSFPSGSMRGKNGIYWGWNPDDMSSTTVAQLNSKTGKKAATYGRYAQITSTSEFKGDQLTSVLNDVKASGAVFIPHVMTSKNVPFGSVTAALAADVAAVLKKFTDEGIEVWLRFAHEMNWYVTDGTYSGSASDFVKAWKHMAAAVKGNNKIKMFWSPNQASSSSLTQWWPGAEYVDIVGIDIYVGSGATFANTFGDFYNAYSKAYNKPFVVGETGAKTSSTSDKESWVKALASADVSAYPCFKSVSWFEYNKEGVDFRVIMDQSNTIVSQTLGNFA